MSTSQSNLDIVYGSSIKGRLQFAGQVQLASGAIEPLAQGELAAAVQRALSAPIEFPAIELAIVPGDRVVLAVDPTVPRVAEVLQCVIDYLGQHGVLPSQFAVVMAGHTDVDVSDLKRLLPDEIVIEVHDSDDQTKVAYVAANKEGEPIYMNRTLVDADVVIPIMCARGRQAIDYEGAYGVFPLLTDRRTRGQFYSLRQLADPGDHQRLMAWADEAAWWVGLLVAIQIIPAEDGGISQVLAGSPQALEAVVQSTMSELWQTELHQTFDCVIAAIDGGPSQQNWDSVARVLAGVSRLVSPDGALIICTELTKRPGRALHKLVDPTRSEDKLAKQLSSDSADDALAAAVLLESLENCHIYLLSKLSAEVVEALGMGAIEDLHQAEHILQQRSRCLLVASAQHRTLSTSTSPMRE